MRKYVYLSVFSVVLGGLLFYFYSQGEETLASGQQDISKLFLMAKEVDASLEKDLLKSKELLLLTYDPLVENEANVEHVCSDLRSSRYSIYGKLNKALDVAIDTYCEAMETKIRRVEHFKSKNAVLRNSLYFIHRLSLQEGESRTKPADGTRKKIIESSLAYLLVSTPEAKAKLQSAIARAEDSSKKRPEVGDLSVVLLHANKLFKMKQELDDLTNQITTANTEDLLEKLREAYFEAYAKSERVATVFRRAVLTICFSFFLFAIYSIVSMWRAAQALTYANSTLEQKVAERTALLEASQQKILDQQQALITSSKMSALGEMAGGVAHEINTPLAVIGMRVEQMEECLIEGDLDGMDFLEGLGVIKQTVDRIAKIVSGLRFFAREGRRVAPQKVKASFLIEETLVLCQERFAQRGVQLEVQKDEAYANLEFECRSVEISQVLLNLLNNAFDAIELSKEKWIKVKVKFADIRNCIEISVTDSGCGIPKPIQDKIMQPFFTTKEVGKGTGLGLSISKGIIEDHQGKLYIDNDCPNTRFVILIPKAQMPTASTGQAA